MSHRPLRSYAKFLMVLGWLHVVVFALAGFAPWFVFAGWPIFREGPWGPWAAYAAPAVGLLFGALLGLGYFLLSGLIRLFLDQRDLLEELLQTDRRLLQLMESQLPSEHAAPTDPFDLSELRGTDEPVL
ncbi:MAG: hypothetical protein EHM71_12680 [Zetaproteobacteria bacterium]|nr:MAG: hypothetical protein EHM71_12680 [Zetaproteobacteria bacterium]